MWSGHFVTFICSYWPCYIPPHRYEVFITIQSSNLHKAKQVCCLLEYQFKTRKIFIFPIIGFPGKYIWRRADKFWFFWLSLFLRQMLWLQLENYVLDSFTSRVSTPSIAILSIINCIGFQALPGKRTICHLLVMDRLFTDNESHE